MGRTINACHDVSLVPDYAIDAGSRMIVGLVLGRSADVAIAVVAADEVNDAAAEAAGVLARNAILVSAV